MWLLILEALAALSLLLFAVWWTMFSGRRPERDDGHDDDGADRAAGDTSAADERPDPPPR